jgi:hypothetical protein
VKFKLDGNLPVELVTDHADLVQMGVLGVSRQMARLLQQAIFGLWFESIGPRAGGSKSAALAPVEVAVEISE